MNITDCFFLKWSYNFIHFQALPWIAPLKMAEAWGAQKRFLLSIGNSATWHARVAPLQVKLCQWSRLRLRFASNSGLLDGGWCAQWHRYFWAVAKLVGQKRKFGLGDLGQILSLNLKNLNFTSRLSAQRNTTLIDVCMLRLQIRYD